MDELSTDLILAWERVEADIAEDRVFFTHPYEQKLLKIDDQSLTNWLKTIDKKFTDNMYSPKAMVICEVPKLGSTLRPGGILALEDHLFFTFLVSKLFPRIHQHLHTPQQLFDYSYQLEDDPSQPRWLKSYFKSYRGYLDDSLKKLDNPEVKFVVFTDITAYYENIEHAVLFSDLNRFNGDEKTIANLRACLRMWSHVYISGRGVPQGFSASDILAKLYLNPVDLALHSYGIQHLRWVDDFRIFCSSESEARLAIVKLTQLLRKRGLNLQSGKTEILNKEDAANKIKGVDPIIKNVKEDYISQIMDQIGIDGISYLPLAEELLTESTEDTPLEVIIQAYENYFGKVPTDHRDFNKTLFRFLLKRLGKQKHDHAAMQCIKYASIYPSETETIFTYLKDIEMLIDHRIQDLLARFLRSQKAIYDYQIYQIFRFLNNLELNEQNTMHIDIIQIARQITFDNNRPGYLRTVTRQFLSQYGNELDVDRIHEQYAHITTPLEQFEIIMGVRRMEKARRNAFFSTVEKQSFLHTYAVKFIKENRN